jgi:hypothetical protein
LFDDEPEEKFVFVEEATVIVDGVIDYDQFDGDLAAKIAGYPDFSGRLFNELKKGGQKLYDRVLADPSLVDQKVEEWEADKKKRGPAPGATGGPAGLGPIPGVEGPNVPSTAIAGTDPTLATTSVAIGSATDTSAVGLPETETDVDPLAGLDGSAPPKKKAPKKKVPDALEKIKELMAKAAAAQPKPAAEKPKPKPKPAKKPAAAGEKEPVEAEEEEVDEEEELFKPQEKTEAQKRAEAKIAEKIAKAGISPEDLMKQIEKNKKIQAAIEANMAAELAKEMAAQKAEEEKNRPKPKPVAPKPNDPSKPNTDASKPNVAPKKPELTKEELEERQRKREEEKELEAATKVTISPAQTAFLASDKMNMEDMFGGDLAEDKPEDEQEAAATEEAAPEDAELANLSDAELEKQAAEADEAVGTEATDETVDETTAEDETAETTAEDETAETTAEDETAETTTEDETALDATTADGTKPAAGTKAPLPGKKPAAGSKTKKAPKKKLSKKARARKAAAARRRKAKLARLRKRRAAIKARIARKARELKRRERRIIKIKSALDQLDEALKKPTITAVTALKDPTKPVADLKKVKEQQHKAEYQAKKRMAKLRMKMFM